MIELLILFTLFQHKSTIYGIKQKIEKRFSVFFNASFGSIHPALKKLEEGKYVSVKSELSSGGQKSKIYSITPEGKKYFTKLLIEDLPPNPALADQMINIKLMAANFVESDTRNKIKESVLKHLELQTINMRNYLSNMDDENNSFQNKFINYNLQKLKEFKNWIEQELKI